MINERNCMKIKLLFSLLLISLTHGNLFSKQSNTIIYKLQNTMIEIPQRRCEYNDAVRKANNSSFSNQILAGVAGSLVGIAIGALCHPYDTGKTLLTAAGCGAGTWLFSKDSIDSAAHRHDTSDAPMNTAFQLILSQAQYRNSALVALCEEYSSLNTFLREVHIIFSSNRFPTIATEQELVALIAYLSRVEKTMLNIINKHESLPSLTQKMLNEYIIETQKTSRVISEILIELRNSFYFKEELVKKQKEDLYNAELERLQRERDALYAQTQQAHSEKARADAEAAQARAEADLKNQEWWFNVFGVPKVKEVHVIHHDR